MPDIGDVWEYSGMGQREVLRLVEVVEGSYVRGLKPDSPPKGGMMLAWGELEECGKLLFAAEEAPDA